MSRQWPERHVLLGWKVVFLMAQVPVQFMLTRALLLGKPIRLVLALPSGRRQQVRMRLTSNWSQGLARKDWGWPLNVGNAGVDLALSVPFQKIRLNE